MDLEYDNEEVIQKPKKSKKNSSKNNDGKVVCFDNVVQGMDDIFGEKSKEISIQTCFLTMLHLANEQTLQFDNYEDEDNFDIYRDY